MEFEETPGGCDALLAAIPSSVSQLVLSMHGFKAASVGVYKSIPPTVFHLVLTGRLIGSFTRECFPPYLISLKFRAITDVNAGVLPQTLKKLWLDYDTVESIIKPGVIPPNVEELRLSCTDAVVGSLPITLKRAHLDIKTFRAGLLPEGLLKLDVEDGIFCGPLPVSLRSLTINQDTVFTLPPGFLNAGLEFLCLDMFSRDLYAGTLPAGLKTLIIWNYVDHKISKGVLPSGLQALEVHNCGSIEPGALPEGLKALSCRYHDRGAREMAYENLPLSLTFLDYSSKSSSNILNLTKHTNLNTVCLFGTCHDSKEWVALSHRLPEGIKHLDLINFTFGAVSKILPKSVDQLYLCSCDQKWKLDSDCKINTLRLCINSGFGFTNVFSMTHTPNTILNAKSKNKALCCRLNGGGTTRQIDFSHSPFNDVIHEVFADPVVLEDHSPLF